MLVINEINIKALTVNPTLLIKYGGNAMTDNTLKSEVLEEISQIKNQGYNIVMVHGGGPYIKQALQAAKIKSEFVDGHRVTSEDAFRHVEMALIGHVNTGLVRHLQINGSKPIGLSGYDAGMVTAKKRKYYAIRNGERQMIDLGLVGDVDSVDTELLHNLLSQNYLPVISCLAADPSGIGYNINADMFAGHLAGALAVDEFIIMTDVDGLYEDFEDKNSLISKLNMSDVEKLRDRDVIQGGMIPKLESCGIALRGGAKKARIVNGTKSQHLSASLQKQSVGTCIEL